MKKEKREILKNFKKSEKGSITIFVLTTMLVIVAVIFTYYFSMMNKSNSQAAELSKIQEEYNQSTYAMEQAYNGSLTTGKIDGSWDEEKKVNTPVIRGNMELVTWDDSQNKFVTDTTNSNYSYDGTTNEWANAKVTIEGVESYFVWIPRYAYKINKSNETIDVRFLIGTSDQYYDDNGDIQTAKRVTEENVDTSSDYYVHPAFTDETSVDFENGGWDEELPGIWVGKYESSLVNKADSSNITTSSSTIGNILLSSNTDKAIAVQPGMTSWRYCTIGNMYTNARGYAPSLNSHMLKNSEWGAVAYLTHSKYGRNGEEVTINNSSNYITGSAGNSVSAASGVGTTSEYWSEQGVLASSTGNVYGIYDLSGGAYEYVAAYYSEGNSYYLNNGSSFTSTKTSDQYSTVYTGINESTDYKIGDATYETKGYNGDNAGFITWNNPFFGRGVTSGNGSSAGVFYYAQSTGLGAQYVSFRMCLAIK